MKGATIRRAEGGDREGLTFLYRRLFRFHEELDRRFRLDLVGMSALHDLVGGMLEDGERSLWVAESSGRLAGFVSGRLMPAPGGDASGAIGDIWVEEAFRRCGLGRRLFATLREEFARRGATSLQLQVAGRNAVARAFWDRLGFREYMDILWWEGKAGGPGQYELPSGVRVRQAEAGDLERVFALWKEQVRAEEAQDGRAHLGPEAEGAFRQSLSRWAGQEDRRVLVAQAGGDALGFAMGLIHANAPFFTLPRYGQAAELFVVPVWRRRGIGTALFATLADWFVGRGVRVVQANVLKCSAAGEHFLRGLGFTDYMLHLWLDLEGAGR